MQHLNLFAEPYTDSEVAVLLNELRGAAERRRVMLNPTERYHSMPLEMIDRLKGMAGHISSELMKIEAIIEKVETMVGTTSAAVLNFDERVTIARGLLVTLAMAKKHGQRTYVAKNSIEPATISIKVAINAYRKLGIDMRKVDPDFAAEAKLGANNLE